MRAIPETRKKYQENVAKPTPVAERGPSPLEIRMTITPLNYELHACGYITHFDAEDGGKDKDAHPDESENRQNQHDGEHPALEAYSLWPEIDQNNAYAIERVEEAGDDQGQRDDANNAGAKERDALSID